MNQEVDTVDTLVKRVSLLREQVESTDRILIALAGVPGSGKSTLAAELLKRLQNMEVEDAAVIPMDGFHLSKATLATFPDAEEALRRRGAAFTFDAEAFVKVVEEVANVKVTNEHDSNLDIYLPGFDHSAQDPTAGEIVIRSTTRIIVLEGNYTLLSDAPWNRVASLAHERWLVEVPREVAKTRLVKRHLLAGIELTAEAAAERVEANDLPNGDYIMSHLVEPDVRICN